MGDFNDGGFSDQQLITLNGTCFVAKIYGAWVNGHYIAERDFSTEIRTSLLSHHADTLQARVNNVGG